MDCSPPGHSVYGISQARILKWGAISFCRGSSQPRNWNWVSCTAGRLLTDWAMSKGQVQTNQRWGNTGKKEEKEKRRNMEAERFKMYMGTIIYAGLECFSSVQSLSRDQLLATPYTAARRASLSITNSWSLLRLMPIESVIPSNHLILCPPLLLPPSNFPSIRVFAKEPALHIRWPKYWSLSFSISPSKVYSGLISFRMDWLDLLAVQETLKSLVQHHNSKASVLWHSAFFIVQLSHPSMTIGKTIALTRWTFVGKVMCLLFNMLSSLVIAFLPRHKDLLISCLQSPSVVILKPKNISLSLFPHLFATKWWEQMPWS